MISRDPVRFRAALAVAGSAFLLALGASPAAAANGQVTSALQTAESINGFVGPIADFDQLGTSVTVVGDIDGNGVDDIAVGAQLDDDGGGASDDYGAVWIMFLDGAGAVIDEQLINRTNGGLGATLDVDDFFGKSVAGLGDLDGDGKLELAVGAPRDDDGSTDRGAVYILSLNSDGTVATTKKISDTAGGFDGTLANGDRFGDALAFIGDVDGDGKDDIAVGAALDNDGGTDRGALWILFLDTDATVLGEQKISDLAGSFAGTLADGDQFGSSIAALGDLDGAGASVAALAVGARLDDDGGAAGSDRGAVWILFLDTDGTVLGEQKISDLAGDFGGTLSVADHFGAAVAAVGDLDGDLIVDLAVGAEGDDDGGSLTGAIWVLFLGTDGKVDGELKLSRTSGNLPTSVPDVGGGFGFSVASFGDADGDGVEDLLAGAPFDSSGGASNGAVWQLIFDGVPVVCGDSILGFGEDCDDGGTAPGDCCDAQCLFEPVGAGCADADLCDGEETCDGAGSCDPGTPLDCDDSEPCTADTCIPASGCINGPALCLVPAKSTVVITDKADDTKDKLKWKWKKGEETQHADLGDPLNATTYRLCVFDESAGIPMLAASLIVPPNGFWEDKDPKGWQLKDKTRTYDGVDKVKLKPGAPGKSQAQLSAKGVTLGALLPGPVGATYFDQDPAVTVQLLNEPEGTCWGSEFTTAKKNEAEIFKARIP